MVEVKFGITRTSTLQTIESSEKIEIPHGELILVSTRRGKDPVLGVFGEYLDKIRYSDGSMDDLPTIYFMRHPHRLKTTELPGINEPLPIFLAAQECSQYRSRSIRELIAGKENILAHLRSEPEDRYQYHLPIIESMQPPYASPEKIAAFLKTLDRYRS